MRLLSMVLAACLLLVGCQAGPKKIVHSTPVDAEGTPVAGTSDGQQGEMREPPADQFGDEPVMMANIDAGQFDPRFVKTRLELYGGKAERWQSLEDKMRGYGLSPAQEEQWQQCTDLLAELVNGYDAVLERQGEPVTVIRRDIAYAESDCEEMFAVQSARIPELLASFQQEAADQATAVIDYYAERQEYEQVVAAYENAVQFKGEKLDDPRLQEIYGRALLHTGRLEKAAQVFSRVINDSGPYEKWPLRLEAAELLIASGQYEKARAEYLHLADMLSAWDEINKSVTDKLALLFAAEDHARELALYSQALQASLASDGEAIPAALATAVRELKKNYPAGIHTNAAEALYQQAEDKVRQHTKVVLATAEELAAAKRFKDSLDLLTELKESLLPADSMTQVELAISSIKASREHHLQLVKEQRIQDLADQWQEGLNLLDMELYDESITVFMGLLGTDYDSRAAAEIDKASLQAARALRKKAATIFIKARNATDPAVRKGLLKESRALLETILERYPQVDIADKVAVNLQVIDEQLMALEEM